jgi:hypothetical protein
VSWGAARGGHGLGGVRRHLNYLHRDWELEIETDDGQRLQDQGTEVIDEWDPELDEERV